MPSPVVETNQILRGILDTTVRIESTMSQSSSGGGELKTLLTGDVSKRSKKINDFKKSTEAMVSTIGMLKAMKEVDITSVMKFQTLPFDKIAETIKKFYDQLHELSMSPSIKSASLMVKGTVDIINMLMTVDPMKLRARILMFPTNAVTKFITKFFIGQGNVENPGGLLGALLKVKKVLNKHFNKAQSAAFKANIQNVESAIRSMGKIFLATTIIGLAAPIALPLALVGFAAIGAVLGMIWVLSKVVNSVKTAITKTNLTAITQMKQYVIAAGSIIAISALVGVISLVAFKPAMLGFGVIIATSFAIALASNIIAKVAKHSVEVGIKSVLGLNLFVLTAAGVILLAYGLSKIITSGEVLKQTAFGIAAIIGTVLVIGFVSRLVNFNAKAAWKGLLGFIPLMLICAASAAMVLGLNMLASQFEWPNIGKSALGILSVIGTFALITAITASLVAYAWLGVLGFIPLALIAFGTIKLTEMSAELADKIDAAGGEELLKTKVEGIGHIMTALVESVGNVSLVKIAKATAVMPAILGLMLATSMMADIIGKFETDGEKMKVLHFDKDGNVTSSKEVNVIQIATALGIAMRNFSKSVLDGLAKAQTPEDGKKKVKLITALMEPVSKFADVVSKFSTGKDGIIKTVQLDENGNVISEREVDIKQVGNTIALGITEFINTIGPAIDGINKMPSISSANVFKDDPAQKLKDALKAVTDFNASLAEIDVNQSKAEQFQKMNLTFVETMKDTFNLYGEGFLKKSTEKNMSLFVKQHVDYIDKMTEALKKNKSPFREYVDTLKEFADQVDRVKSVIDEEKVLKLVVDKSTKNDTTNNYKMDSNDFKKVAEAFQEPVRDGVKEGMADLQINVENVKLLKDGSSFKFSGKADID